jgi:hypothetical protein
LPVPHSATTMAVRACCQRLATPILAIVCAGKGFRSSPAIRVEIASSNCCSAGYSRRCALPKAKRGHACSRKRSRVQALETFGNEELNKRRRKRGSRNFGGYPRA